MKTRYLISLFLTSSVSYLVAQDGAAPAGELPTLRQAINTIDAVDQLSAERQEEVLSEGIQDNRVVPELPDEPEPLPVEDTAVLDLPGAQSERISVARASDTISIDFPQEDVRTIIRNVAELYELNVVIPDTLIGSVSIKLRNVTWNQVFDVILEPLNFTYVEEGNIIKIKSRDDLLAEPVDTRVFIVNFAKAAEIQSSIMPLIDSSAGGKMQVDNRSNALVITERPSRMNQIREIIDTLDRPTEQVMIESKFVEITGRDQKNLGVGWDSLSGYSVGGGPFSRSYTNSDGRLTNRNKTYEDLFERTDGVNTTTERNDFSRNSLWTGDLMREDTAVFSADAFNLVLSALERDTQVELVSNPTVVTVNNTSAQINIGEEYPIPSYNYNQEQGTFEVSGFEYKPIGINLSVTPQINSAGFINLKILPEISSRTGEINFGGAADAVIPIITTRKTESTVTIKSGYTLAIGGLIEKSSENTDSRVPVLGDVPLLGRLFRSENKSIDSRNLIVFITAKILSASGATYRDVFSQRTLHEMGIKSRDLPGYEPPQEERELFEALQRNRDAVEQLQTEARLKEQLMILNRTRDKESKKQGIETSGSDSDSDTTPPRRFK